uniref:Uncharacterized protein n=1 Tax=Eutreptiella gymnastica TaxID=73025 RepID=A0A7S1J752_9EUGL|mmetsp:Transcript_71912/g.126720  ORF Transcript_71912/g.126720 Transcript_71912/m.126720 type:complete len:125 (+) Transcript_71912:532-906(+)
MVLTEQHIAGSQLPALLMQAENRAETFKYSHAWSLGSDGYLLHDDSTIKKTHSTCSGDPGIDDTAPSVGTKRNPAYAVLGWFMIRPAVGINRAVQLLPNMARHRWAVPSPCSVFGRGLDGRFRR